MHVLIIPQTREGQLGEDCMDIVVLVGIVITGGFVSCVQVITCVQVTVGALLWAQVSEAR